MKVITIANTKGGSGKTTTACELGYYLAQHGRVLLIDLDPLAALTLSMGLESSFAHSFGAVARKGQPSKLSDVLTYKTDHMAIVTGSRELAITDTELKNQPSGAFALKKVLETVKESFDFVIVDTQGAAGKLIENAIVAADVLLIPFRPQGQDLLVLREFIELVQDTLTIPTVKVEHIALLPIGYKSNINQHQQAIEAVKAFGYPMLSPIKDSTKLGEAATQGVSLAEWDKNNPRVEEYAVIGKLVRSWVNA